ncbi:MAG: ABC transporter permease [Candidatus Polarisedimenticolia bacterium]
MATDGMLEGIGRDLRYTARWLLKTPGFSAAVIATLALAIGANCAIFSVVHAVLLRQLPFGEPGALVAVWSRQPSRDDAPFNIPDFVDLRDGNDTLEQMAGIAPWNATLTGEGAAERLQGARVSANLFALLRVGASAGRPLVAGDDRPDATRVVVLTDAFWRRRFGASRSVLGRRLTLDGEGYSVAGVLPPTFVLPTMRDVDLVAPLAPDTDPRRAVRASIAFLRVVGRLKPGVSLERAEQNLSTIADRLRHDHPDTNERKIGALVVPLAAEIVGDVRASLLMLSGAVGAVLVIACANLASLFLARGAARQKEMASRLALGATPARLVRQLLTETSLFVSLGGLCGVGLAALGVRLLAAVAPLELPRRGDIRLDGAALLFTLGVSLIAGVLVGGAPAILAARTSAIQGLNATPRGSSTGRGERRALQWLIAAEVCIALVLLVVVGLLTRSFSNLQAIDPGFQPQAAIGARVSLAGSGYRDRDSVLTYQRRVLERLTEMPAVEAAGAVSISPLSGQMVRVDFTVEGRPIAPQDVPTAQYRMVTPGYFAAMRVPLNRGRMLTALDAATSAPVVLVNETLARRFLAGSDPIGARLIIDDNDTAPRPVTVVGIVGDVKQLTLEGDPTNDLYLPYEQLLTDNLGLAKANMTWIVRTRVDPGPMVKPVREAIERADVDVPIAGVTPLDDHLSSTLAPRRFNLFVIAVFALTAVGLAATGTYAVLSYAVSRRVDELAIRRSLGARPIHILWLVLSQAMRPVLAGIVVGTGAAAGVTRLLTAMLFGIEATDPVTFAGVTAALLGVAAAACLVPALRAARARDVVRG